MSSKDFVLDYVCHNPLINIENLKEGLMFNVNQYKMETYLSELEDEGKLVCVTHDNDRAWILPHSVTSRYKSPRPTWSAGVVYHCTSDDTVLLVHPTNQLYWDVPKGRIDAGETEKQAAIRELKEETGISIDDESIGMRERSGMYTFNRYKEVCLFKYARGNKVEVKDLVCTSYFDDHRGNSLPEIDAFAWVNKEDIYTYLPYQIHNVVRWCL